MCTACVLTVSPSMLCAGGRGGAWSQGGAWSGGMYLVLGGCLVLGGYPIMHWGRPPLWTEWHTSVKILPCPKLRLRAVMTLKLLRTIGCMQITIMFKRWDWSVRNYIKAYLSLFIVNVKAKCHGLLISHSVLRAGILPRNQSKNRNNVKNLCDTIN